MVFEDNVIGSRFVRELIRKIFVKGGTRVLIFYRVGANYLNIM